MSHCRTCRPDACRCNCGYVCGGPGVCEDPNCLQNADGTHYVEDCDHKFGGDMQDLGGGLYSSVCQSCGMSAMSHGMRCGP